MTSSCPVDPIIIDENSFFNWLNTGDKSCPTPEQVLEKLAETTSSNSNESTTIYQTEQEIHSLKKIFEAHKADVEVAKDRAAMVLRPEITASYYDSWFPIGRPLKQISVPILIGFATFFTTLSLFTLLEIFGISNTFSVHVPFEKNPAFNPLTQPFWIMTGMAMLFFVITVYLFVRG